MKYNIEEQETLLRFDPISKLWIYETNYYQHINAILKHIEKNKDALTINKIEKDDRGNVTYIQATSTNTEDFPMPSNRFGKYMLPKKKRHLSEADRQKAVERLNRTRK